MVEVWAGKLQREMDLCRMKSFLYKGGSDEWRLWACPGWIGGVLVMI